MFKKIINSDFIRKFIKFGLVGIVNTGVDFSVYIALTRLIPFFFTYYLLAHAIGFIAANINSFYLNKYWTFKDNGGQAKTQYPKFLAFQVIGLGLTAIIIKLSIEYLHVHDIMAKVFASVSVMIWNFFLSKYIVFKIDSSIVPEKRPNISL